MMDIVKKNLLSIICGIIVLLAIAASVYPLGGYVEELQGKLASRKTVASDVEGMATKQRQLPVVDPDTTETQPLTTFPSDAIIHKGEEVTKQVNVESLKMRDAAVAMNLKSHLDPATKQPLLLPGSLPDAQPGVRIRFKEEYRVKMPVPVPAQQPAPGAPIVTPALAPLAQAMRGGVPPLPAEISRRQEEESKKIADEGGNIPGNKPAVDALVAERRAKIPDEMQTAAALKCLIYVNPEAFDVNTNITAGGGLPPDPVNIFLAQVGYWVQKDVVAALLETNMTLDPATSAAPKNVIEAPVKRLHKISITPQFVTGAAAGAAPPPPSDPNTPLPKITTASPTGRVSNGLFDVVHFTMLVDVEAEKLPLFLQTLGRNRFMNATVVEFKTLDSAKIQAEGFRYGAKPVVAVNMQCEALLFRQWTTPLMPARFKQMLGIAAPTAVAAQ